MKGFESSLPAAFQWHSVQTMCRRLGAGKAWFPAKTPKNHYLPNTKRFLKSILKLNYYFSLSLCVFSFSSFYPDLGFILFLLLGLARKWKTIPISRCCLHDMLVMQGRNCFFTVDGNGFSVDYWWCCCFYLQPLVTYKMDKRVADFQKQRFLFQRGLQLHENVQDGLC